MRLYKHALMGGVAALALGGFTVGTMSAAQAYDNKVWTWNLTTTTNINETVNININIDPIGKVLDEVMQIQIGDVKSTAEVAHVYNWKPLEEVEVKTGYSKDFNLTVDGGYHYNAGGYGFEKSWEKTTTSNTDSFAATLSGGLETDGNGIPFFIGGAGVLGGAFVSPGGSVAGGAGVIGAIGAYATDGQAGFTSHLEGSLNNTNVQEVSSSGGYLYGTGGYGNFGGNLNVSVDDITTIYTYAPKLQNALTELPKVAAVSTSIGNLISIESDTAVQENSLQVVFDDVDRRRVNFDKADFDLDADLNLQDAEPSLDSGNYNHDVALLLGLSAGAGLIEQADITASAKAYDIWNAQTEATATAIGNIKSIDLETVRNANGLIIADITQLSVANVSADASVTGVNLINYTNLGKLDEPIAKATATAIGNAVNIKLNSGQGVPTPTP